MNFWRVRRCVVAGTGLAVLLAGLSVFAPGARAQNPDNMRVMLDRMQRLERDIRTLNLQLSRGTPPPVQAPAQPSSAAASAAGGIGANSPALARLNVRLSALEGDLRSATGAMEDLGFQLGQFRQRLDQLVSDIDYRLGVLEGRAPGASRAGPVKKPRPPRLSAAPAPPPVQKIIPGQQGGSFAAPPSNLGTVSQTSVAAIKAPTGSPAVKPPPQSASPSAPKSAVLAPPPAAQPAPAPASAPSLLPEGTSKEQYNYAFGLLRQANYDKAELALQEFVRLHPKEALASNARYWLGETYYVRSAFVQAADVFLEGYKTDPKGPKASDSLLKLGMSLGGLDKKREACATFDKLIKDFPDISAGVKSTLKREKQKNGCS